MAHGTGVGDVLIARGLLLGAAVLAAWVAASAVNAARPLAVGGLTALPVVDESTANLLRNPSFETRSPSPATIPEWHTLEGDALNLDSHGKALSFLLLELPLQVPTELLPLLRGPASD